MTTNATDRASSILDKAFDLLGAFDDDRRVLSLTELARCAGLPKPTVHRILGRLLALDAVEKVEGGYSLSVQFLQLGAAAPAVQARDLAMPHMMALNRRTGLTVHFGVLRVPKVVYLEALPGVTVEVPRITRGSRHPVLETAMGRALLAWTGDSALDDLDPADPGRSDIVDFLRSEAGGIRERGFSVSNFAGGDAIAVAAPVAVSEATATAGGLEVLLPPAQAATDDIVREVRRAASAIAEACLEALAAGRARYFPPRSETSTH